MYVIHNGTKSIQSQVTSGVPKGLILWPLLFLICMNVLHKVMKNAFLILFAKDSNLFYTGNDMVDVTVIQISLTLRHFEYTHDMCLLMTNDIIQTNLFLAKLILSLAPLLIHITLIDIIMSVMASQITGIYIVCSTVGSGADQRKHQSSTSLAIVQGIHRWLVNSLHKRLVTWKIFPFDDVIMCMQ